MSYAFDAGEIKTWFAEDGTFPVEVIEYINSCGQISAHNAQFERYLFDFVIGNDFGFTPPKLEQWQCTSARAMAHGLPASLGDICNALDLPLQKQKEGARLIREYSAPGHRKQWKGDDKKLMREYCEMDVATMRQFCSVLRELSPKEWEQYHVTEKMNDRGVPVQVEFAKAALAYSEEVKSEVDEKIRKLTSGEVKNARARKARDTWFLPLLTSEQLKLITKHKDGKEGISLDKEHQGYLLSCDDLDGQARKFVELLQDAGGSSISKFKSMVNLNHEGRVYCPMVWNGAGQTGRYSSRGLQLQNFNNKVFDNPDELIADVLAGKPLDKPANTLGRLTRSAITSPEGLTYSDYSQIEARVLPWLCGAEDYEAEEVLDVFRNGRDIYSENAVGMFNLPSIEAVTKDLRQSAKVAVLACGFGGGANALLSMAKAYGMKLDHDEAKHIVELWRTANPWAERLWYGLKLAAHQAVSNPHTVQRFGRIKFSSDGKDFLWAMLPSGRCLAYMQPKFELVDYPWGDSGVELTCLWGGGKPKAGQKWLRRTLNHLILSENVTQGAAADVMRETLVRADRAGLKTLFSVHDEMIVEGECFDKLNAIMETPPAWADCLPIAADTQFAMRYGK
jgi:DNA polymerase